MASTNKEQKKLSCTISGCTSTFKDDKTLKGHVKDHHCEATEVRFKDGGCHIVECEMSALMPNGRKTSNPDEAWTHGEANLPLWPGQRQRTLHEQTRQQPR